MQADAGKKRVQWRIGHKSPIQMHGIAENLEFIAVNSIAIVREQMEERNCARNREQRNDFRLIVGALAYFFHRQWFFLRALKHQSSVTFRMRLYTISHA